MAKGARVQDRLGEVPLFTACSKRELSQVARHIEEVSCPAGTVLAEQGAAGDAFYVIVAGRAVVRRNGRKIATLGPGDFFGELALLDPGPRDATVVSDSDLVAAKLAQAPFKRLLREVPAMNDKLLKGLARRLREADFRDTGP